MTRNDFVNTNKTKVKNKKKYSKNYDRLLIIVLKFFGTAEKWNV